MDTDRHEKLRQRAYRIWESEGRPDGMEAEHWSRAESELAAEEAGTRPPPASRSRKKASPPEEAVGVVADVPVKQKRAAAPTKPAPRKKKD